MSNTPPSPSRDIVFDCPQCGRTIAIDERAAGMEIDCPHCQGAATVPARERQDAGSAEVADGSLPPRRRDGALPKGGAAELAGEPGTSGGDGVLAALASGEIEAFPARQQGKHIVFGCPFCSRPVEIKARQQGDEVRCLECSGKITAPYLAAGVEAVAISGLGGTAGDRAVALPAPGGHASAGAGGEGGVIPHRLNEDKITKLVPRDEAEAGFDLENAWKSYPDAKPAARIWSRRFNRLSIVAMLAVMVAALAASIVWISRMKNASPGASGEAAGAAAEGVGPSPSQRALAVIEGFSRATTVVDRMQFVRSPDRAISRMRSFYGRVQSDVALPSFNALSYEEFDAGGRRFASLESIATGTASKRKVWLEIPANGAPQLDWASAVGYCEYDIIRFASEPPPRSVEMRVLVRPSDYYNYEFSDANTLASYQITDLAGRAEIYGYAIRNSDAAEELKKLHPLGAAAGEGSYINCILIVSSSSTERRKPPLVWIEEVVAIGWLLP